MNCNDFLALHSDWLDGLLEPSRADALNEHAVACASCARYDSVVRRGLELARTMLPVVEVSAEFEARVRHRLFHERDTMARRRGAAASAYGVAASVILVTAAAGVLAIADSRTPVVDGAVVFAAAPPAMSELDQNAVAVEVEPSLALGRGHEDAPVDEPEKVAEVQVASTSEWPVYSRGAVAVAFPASRNDALVRPADFRPSAAIVAPLLIRY